MTDIGQRITFYRNLHNLTQTQVAKTLGISRSAVNAWEMGFSVPQLKHIIALAAIFGVSIDTLAIGDNDRTVIDISNLNTEEKALVMQLVRCLRKRKE